MVDTYVINNIHLPPDSCVRQLITLTGNFKLFLNQLNTLLKSLYNTDVDFIVCGHMNTDYLIDSYNKKQLDTMFLSYNLTNTVQFPTRIQNNSKTAIDNIFSDITKFSNYTVQPIYMTYLIMMHRS